MANPLELVKEDDTEDLIDPKEVELDEDDDEDTGFKDGFDGDAYTIYIVTIFRNNKSRKPIACIGAGSSDTLAAIIESLLTIDEDNVLQVETMRYIP